MLSIRPILTFSLLVHTLTGHPPVDTMPAPPGRTPTIPAATPARDTIPRPVGYINDFEHLFTPLQIEFLDSLIHEYERRTTIEIAVLTVDTSLTLPANFDFFTLQTMKAWGVGKKSSNNGILIGISRSFRKIRIQDGGGIEKQLPGADVKKIIDEAFIPFFRKGQYYEGLVSGLRTLMQRLE
ncbi:MAG: TPM domain-containing protein [Bacteroidetes bacterium]|nr:TPM domain-containing protein [Bacteroidota bacterium]